MGEWLVPCLFVLMSEYFFLCILKWVWEGRGKWAIEIGIGIMNCGDLD